MPIRSLHETLKGQAVDVGGKIIHVDAHGIVSDADADVESELLSQTHNWAPHDSVSVVPATPDASGTVREHVAPIRRGRPSKVRMDDVEVLPK